MLDRRTWIILACLAASHLVLALWFASFTPYHTSGMIGGTVASDIGAPDEFAHATYVNEILQGRGAPSLDLAKMKSDKVYRGEHYEDHQPPVFYFLDAGWAKLLGVSDIDEQSAGLKLRSLNAIFGSGTVFAAFFTAFWGFKRIDLACGAAGIVAFLPMNVALSGALSNDPLLFCELGWVLALATRGLRNGWGRFDLLALGVLAGLAIVTKTTGLVSLPVILAAILLPQAKRATWPSVAVGIAVCALICVPWFARNQRIYGDALGLKVFNEAFSDTATKEQIEQIITSNGGNPSTYWTEWVGWTVARSFIGAFGYMDIWLNESGTARSGPNSPNTLYRVTLAFLALLSIGWILSLQKPWTQEAWTSTALNGVMLLTVLFLFVRFDSVYYQAQARYIYPALIPLAIGFASGAVTLGANLAKKPHQESQERKYSGYFVGSVMALFLGLTIYTAIRLPGEFQKRELNNSQLQGYSPANKNVQG